MLPYVWKCCFIQQIEYTYCNVAFHTLTYFELHNRNTLFLLSFIHSITIFLLFQISRYCTRIEKIIAHSYGAFTKCKALCGALHIALLTGKSDIVISTSPIRGETLKGYWTPGFTSLFSARAQTETRLSDPHSSFPNTKTYKTLD